MPIKRLNEDNMLKFQNLSREEKERRGILGRLYGKVADFTNGTRNGRKYTEELWENLFNSDLIKERFANGGIFGQLCHPDYEDVDMEKVACVMPEPPVKDKDGQLVAYVDILDTPCGKIAYQLAKYGYKLGISSRGSGDLITGPDGEEEVDPNTYQLTAFDLVEIPAVQSARLSFVESLDKKRYNKTLRQSLTESLKKASDSDRKLMQESLKELGINLNESTLVTKGDSLQGEEEYPILDQGYDSLSEKKLYKIMGNDGKERWIPESDAKFVIDKGFEPAPEEPEVEEPAAQEPVIEEAVTNESSSQEIADYWKKFKEANPDVEMNMLVDEFGGNIGSILYNEQTFKKFVDWAKHEHGVTINPIPKDTSFDDAIMDNGPVEEEPTEEPVEAPEDTGEETVETPEEGGDEGAITTPEDSGDEGAITVPDEQQESLNEEGVQLADMGQIPQGSEGLLKEAVGEPDMFYVNPYSPFGTEISYKGYTITVADDDIYVDVDGDWVVENSLEDAVKTIDDLDADPDYHREPWYDEENTSAQLRSIKAVKTLLGEAFYKKDKKGYQKVAEADGIAAIDKEMAEPVDESLLESLMTEGFNPYMRALETIDDCIDELNRTGREDEIFNLLQGIIDQCRSLAEEHGIMVESLNHKLDEECEDESLSDKEVGDAKSEGVVAELQEALKKARKLNKDNLSLQEKLSASNARESQLEEELGRYKKATISLSKSAKETKSLKESLNKKDKESKDLTEKLTTVTSKNDETNKKLDESLEEKKKLSEQLEQLKTRVNETAKQLADSKTMVEKYRKSYKALKESYVETKANYYGVSKDAALKALGESYKVSDVDKTLRELGATKRNMGKLPINLNESAKITKANLSVKTSTKSLDDTSIDTLLSLLD